MERSGQRGVKTLSLQLADCSDEKIDVAQIQNDSF
jgi:hypothetical protein